MFGDTFNDVEHAADGFAVCFQLMNDLRGAFDAFSQLLDGRGCLHNDGFAALGFAVGIVGSGGRRGGIVGDFAHSRTHFIHRGGDLFSLLRLFVDIGVGVTRHCAHFLRRGGQLRGGTADLLYQCLEFFDHMIEADGDITNFVFVI